MSYVDTFSSLMNFIEPLILGGGYIILFVSMILEGIPLVGMVVPGHIIIIIGGFLAKLGTLDLVWVIIISICGALIGDYLGFMVGKRYGMSFIKSICPYFLITDNHIEKANKLLATHTGKALIIGRFTPATRALMPFLVGTTPTSGKKFWFYNILGGISWVTSSVLLGYLFGTAYYAVSGYVGKALFVAIILTFIFIWGYKFINLRFHMFKRYELFTLILNILSLWAFATIVDRLTDNSFRLNFDVWISLFVEKYIQANLFLIEIAKIISHFGNVYATTIAGIIFGIILAFKRKWRSSAIMFLSITLTGLASGILKTLFMSPRPINTYGIILSDPSFPSSHASMAAAFFIIIAYLLAPKISCWIKRESMIVICVLITIAIGLSRIILNVHWFSDVVAGWSLGIFFATASILFVRYVGILVTRKQFQK